MTDALHRLIELDRIEDRSLAIDVGAGGRREWSTLLSVHFRRVIAFEGAYGSFQELLSSCGDLGNVDMHNREVLNGAGRLKVDDLEIDQCGLIRISAAGNEVLVLRGAEKTVRRCQPVVIVEVAGRTSYERHTSTAAVGWLIGFRYRELLRAGADRVFVPH